MDRSSCNSEKDPVRDFPSLPKRRKVALAAWVLFSFLLTLYS